MKLDRHAGMEADLQRVLAADARLLLRPRPCTAWIGRRCATKYEPLVTHVNHRADLTYVIGEMIGELNGGHAYVGGGDMPHPPRIPIGPARRRSCARDPATGIFKIVKILHGESWRSEAAFAADRDRRRRQGGRLHPRHQRQADQRDGEHLRGARRQGRQAGDAQDQRGTEGEGQPRDRRRAHRQRRRRCIITIGSRATSRR